MFKLRKEKIKNVLSQLSSRPNGNRMTGEIERHTAPDVGLVFLAITALKLLGPIAQ